MTTTEIKAAIVAYMTAKPGHIPNYKTVGGYDAAKPVFDAMRASGEIVEGIRLSPTGKRMFALYLAK